MARQGTVLRQTEVPGPLGSRVRLEAKPLAAISKADVETLRDERRAALVASQAALADVQRLEDTEGGDPGRVDQGGAVGEGDAERRRGRPGSSPASEPGSAISIFTTYGASAGHA